MLTDRTIARTLGEGVASIDRRSFHEYIFGHARPSFIASRAYHSWIARLDDDPRFRRDYVAIVEYRDDWVRKRYGAILLSGDFVRRDVLGTRPDETLAKLTEAVKGTHYVGCINCD